MKMVIKAFMVTILAFILAVGGTACMDSHENMGAPSTSDVETSEEGGSTEATDAATVSTSTEDTKAVTTSEKQIVEAVYGETHKSLKKDDVVANSADAMSKAAELSDRYLGRVNSEEDAKEKAEAVWVEIDKGMFEYIKNAHESKNRPYVEACFYEEYDVWYVGTVISGTTDDGRSYGLTGGLHIIIQKSDGKVLATW